MPVSDNDFINYWMQSKSSYDAQKRMGYADRRSMMKRRRLIEKKYGPLPSLGDNNNLNIPETCLNLTLTGTMVIFSDCHWWPNIPTPATEIMIKIIEHIQPEYVIGNGDLFDGAMVSRHSRLGWDHRPTPQEEIDTCKMWLGEIEAVSDAKYYRTIGNHDLRFDTYLSSHAGLMDGIKGIKLSDHVKWPDYWAITVNGDTVIKHRYKGGTHSAFNNTRDGGVNMVTGHTHRLSRVAYTDYRGTRYGVECGTLADPLGPQFQDYTEMNPLNWQPGFVVMHPDEFELVYVNNGRAKWGGKTWST